MKYLKTGLLAWFAIAVLLGMQATAVNAEDINIVLKEGFRQELIREIRETARPPKLENRQVDVKVEQKERPIEKKAVSYVSIISLIVNDALGHANKDIRVRSYSEAGRTKF